MQTSEDSFFYGLNNNVVYQEVLGEGVLTYTVFKSDMTIDGENHKVYGIGVESNFNDKKEHSFICDFSVDLKEAIKFMELIVRNTVSPVSLPYIVDDFLNS